MDCEKIIRLMIIPRVDWKKMLFWALCKIITEKKLVDNVNVFNAVNPISRLNLFEKSNGYNKV